MWLQSATPPAMRQTQLSLSWNVLNSQIEGKLHLKCRRLQVASSGGALRQNRQLSLTQNGAEVIAQ